MKKIAKILSVTLVSQIVAFLNAVYDPFKGTLFVFHEWEPCGQSNSGGRKRRASSGGRYFEFWRASENNFAANNLVFNYRRCSICALRTNSRTHCFWLCPFWRISLLGARHVMALGIRNGVNYGGSYARARSIEMGSMRLE